MSMLRHASPLSGAPVLRSFEGAGALLVALALAWSTLTIWAPPRWPVSIAQAAILLLGALLGVRLVSRPGCLRAGVPLVLVAAGVIWLFLLCATGRTAYAFESWRALSEWLVVLALVALGSHLFAAESLRRRFLEGFLWFAVAVAVVALVQFYAPNGKVFWIFASRYPDVLGPFQNRNNFAAFAALAVPVALWRALGGRGLKLAYVSAAAALAGAVVASGSRAGSAIVIAEILLVILIACRQRRVPAAGALPLAAWTLALSAVAVGVAGWELLWRRLQAGDFMIYRRQIWASALEMIGSQPLTGFGPGTFQTVYPAFATFDVGLVVNHAHSDWLGWAAEAGLPFVLLMAGVALWAVRPALRSVWGVGLLAVFAHALVDYPLARLGVAGWVWLLVGMLEAESAGDRRSPLSP